MSTWSSPATSSANPNSDAVIDATKYAVDYVPFAPRLMDGVIVAVVSRGISLIATIYPSWSASRILPAEALRYE